LVEIAEPFPRLWRRDWLADWEAEHRGLVC